VHLLCDHVMVDCFVLMSPFQNRFRVYCGPSVWEVESDGLYFTLIFIPKPVLCVLCVHVLEAESVGVYCSVLLFPFQSRFHVYRVPMFWRKSLLECLSFPKQVPC
jgi:hypothetical protein